jgi:hypothetical protein
MNEEQTGQEPPVPDRIPQRIYEGMPVYDSQGEVIGTVQVMYYGGASEEAIQKMLETEEAGAGDSSAFDADNVPKEMRARFMRGGYILVEGPDLTGVQRYIGPEQIEGVVTQDIEGRMTETVRLRATRAELINAD